MADEMNDTPTPEDTKDNRWSVSRMAIIFVGAFLGLQLLIFIVGLVLALADVQVAGAVISLFRDYVLLVLALEGVLIIAGLAIVAVQVARLVNLIRAETRPILSDARETVGTLKTTAEFVGKEMREPVAQTRSFMAGLTTFVRELLAIRRLIRRRPPADENGAQQEPVTEDSAQD